MYYKDKKHFYKSLITLIHICHYPKTRAYLLITVYFTKEITAMFPTLFLRDL